MFLFILTSCFIFIHIWIATRRNNQPLSKHNAVSHVTSYKELSLLIPCYNEAVIMRSAIYSLVKQEYPNLEIVLINDGSEDRTMDILKKELELETIENREGALKARPVLQTYHSKKYKNIFVIDKQNGGKADSLNAGINFTNKEYVVTLDADSILKEDALYEMNASLQDEAVIALGGNVIVAQGVMNYSGEKIICKLKGNRLERAQFLEYLRGFLILKNSSARMNALMVISGAFGIFNRDIMLKLNGFEDTVGEDIDITIKFSQYAKAHGKKVTYNDKALCFTEVPNNWSDVKKQRVRWQKAFMDALKNHRSYLVKNLFKNKLSFLMIVESTLLMYSSTLLTLIGVAYVVIDIFKGQSISPWVYYVFLLGLIIQVIYNVVTFKMAEQRNLSLKGISFLQVVGTFIYELIWYRPLMILIILYGSVAYFFNSKGWNKVNRIGFSDTIVLDEEDERVA